MYSFSEMAKFFGNLAAGSYKRNLEPALEQIGQAVLADVKAHAGLYQDAIGPFPSTPPLSAVTLEIKSRRGHGKGGNPDTPLYATGRFRSEVGYRVDRASLSVEIGTNLDYIARTEVGDANMPPRPIFGPAVFRVVPNYLPTLASAGFTGQLGGTWKNIGLSGITFTPAGPNNSFHT